MVRDINSIALVCSCPFPETDIKADNVMFVAFDGTDSHSIKRLCDESPQIIDGEFESKGAHYQIMRSQPIPNPCRWNDRITVDLYTFCLSGLCGGKYYLFCSIAITGSQTLSCSAVGRQGTFDKDHR